MIARQPGATPAEVVAWLLVALGVLVLVVAAFAYGAEASRWSGDTTAPAAWMAAGAGIATLAVVPALVLTGIRQLLDRR